MKTNNQAKPKASEVHYWLYSTGNFANNIIFMMVGTYITYFYTNILGISPAMAGLVFMVARLVDAFTDPLMGIIVDKTNTKIGKYRPWIIAGAPFLGIMFVLLFTAPNFSMTGKVVYAFITYIIYSLAWTIVQIPQLALPAILTNDIAKRTRIQAIFQAFGSIASLVVSAWALPILDKLGGQDNASAAVMFTYIAITFTWTINNMLSRSAVLDSANYAQMTLGINGTALVNSTFTFVNKCCQAFSMFFSGIILSATGYNKDAVEQTPGCLKAILLLCTVGPIIAYVFSIAAMYFYPLTRKGEVEMQEKLDKMSFVNLEDDLIL